MNDGGSTEADGVAIAPTGPHLSYVTILHPCGFNILI